MRLRTIAAGRPFLDVLARWWLAESGPDPLAAADGLILLPTRRAARSLSDAFLRASDGRPLLLPRIVALGAIDEAPLALAGALDLPPAVEPAKRLAVLTRLVLQLRGAGGAPTTADGAWRLARELAALLDDAYREGVALGDKLPEAADAGYAQHWMQTLRFLTVVTQQWPLWLADNGLMDGAERALRLLDVQAASWDAEPPQGRVVVAGTTGGVKAVAGLMRVVARLPRGCVVLPALDLAMAEAVWAELDDSHPQAGMARLLGQMGATRGDVAELTPSSAGLGAQSAPSVGVQRQLSLFDPHPDLGALCAPSPEGEGEQRAGTIDRALLPAAALHSWRDPFAPQIGGLQLLAPADQQEEAVAVALALREALEKPGVRAALVTPDRALALRVSAELARYGVIVDDSAGEPLADTPPATFLRLLARAVADGLAPVALLAVLKHPLAGFGLRAADCRRAARRLERRCLRGPPPPPGIAGLRAKLVETGDDPAVADLLDRLDERLAPLLDLATRDAATPETALDALVDTAERAAETDDEEGAARLWALEEGEALATHLVALGRALDGMPAQPLAVLPGLLDAAMLGAVVRSRRALRGREGAEHPRIVILGLLEARLQSFDVLVLGGLAEGVWPSATDPGPWMSRPMRKAVGLASPEQRVGQMAHDFAALACAAPAVILSCPRRRDGAPAVPARWLVRLRAFLAGHATPLPAHPAAPWSALLDQPDGRPQPVDPPAPSPPLALRPRRLSVTQIETWLRDPYAIYARHVLHLRALDPLEQNADAADYGTIVHTAVAAFIDALPVPYPADAAMRLRGQMDRVLAERALRPALAAWWRPRLHRIADWLAEEERSRRAQAMPLAARCEVEGEWAVPAAEFVLKGVADRIERRADGALALLDYKTGTLPAAGEIEKGYAPQLLLEAAMAEDGAFGADLRGPASELAYWRLTGGIPAGEIRALFKNDALPGRVADTVAQLVALIRAFDDEDRAYLSQPHPGATPRFSDYAQLARVAEWAVLDDA